MNTSTELRVIPDSIISREFEVAFGEEKVRVVVSLRNSDAVVGLHSIPEFEPVDVL